MARLRHNASILFTRWVGPQKTDIFPKGSGTALDFTNQQSQDAKTGLDIFNLSSVEAFDLFKGHFSYNSYIFHSDLSWG